MENNKTYKSLQTSKLSFLLSMFPTEKATFHLWKGLTYFIGKALQNYPFNYMNFFSYGTHYELESYQFWEIPVYAPICRELGKRACASIKNS